MGRSPCCAKEGLNRGAWTALEDKILKDYINQHGEGRWRSLPKKAGLKRCGKSCRLRWLNYLRPDIKRGNISADEEELIIRLHKLLGNRWSLIAGRLPGRTDNEIKNYWNTNLGKKVKGHQQDSTTIASKHNKTVKKNETHTVSSAVVRTRAIRCSKVFINPYPERVDPSSDRGSNSNNLNGDSIRQVPNQTSEYVPINGVSLSENSEDYKKISEPIVDFNSNVMGEFNLSDLLNFDFDPSYDQSSNALSPSSDQPLVFAEEMLQDWTSNLNSWASFLDCGDQEWFA